jgi:hypothetical protein
MKRFRNVAFVVLVGCVLMFGAEPTASTNCVPDPWCECIDWGAGHLFGTCPYYDDCTVRYPSFCDDASAACNRFCDGSVSTFDCYPGPICYFNCYCTIIPRK